MAGIGLSELDRHIILEWAARHPEIKQVFLYGSRARGDHHSGSDIDLAVVMCFQEWFGWHPRYKAKPDLHLSAAVHLEWYLPDSDLECVGSGVEQDGVLLYEK